MRGPVGLPWLLILLLPDFFSYHRILTRSWLLGPDALLVICWWDLEIVRDIEKGRLTLIAVLEVLWKEEGVVVIVHCNTVHIHSVRLIIIIFRINILSF